MQNPSFVSFMAFALLLPISGCSSGPSNAVHVDAFDRSGQSTFEMSSDKIDEMNKHGMIVSFAEGDEIILELGTVESDLVEQVDSHTLRVKRPFYLYMSDRGFHVSLDGEDFRRDVTDGSVSLGFKMGSNDRKNKITLSVNERLTE